MTNQLDIDKINKMVDNTLDLQNQAVNAINGIKPGRKIKVFDPRNEKDIVSEDGKVIWTTKSIEIALKALKDGYSLRKSPFFRGDTSLRKADLNFQYTQEELLEVIKCKNDIVYFANNYVFLKTGEGRKRIKLRPYQIKVLKQMQEERFSILLQSRQTGKCFSYNTKIKIIRNLDNGETKEEIVKFGDFILSFKKQVSFKEKIISLLWNIYDKLDNNK